MRKVTFAFTLLILYLLSSCNSESSKQSIDSKVLYPDHPNYTLTAEQTGYDDESDGDVAKFGVHMKLTAKYDTLPPFIYMTCSWGRENGFVSDHNYLVGYHGCDANFWYANHLMLGDTLHIKTILAGKEKFEDWNGKKIRVGFGIVDTLNLSYNSRFWMEVEEYDQWEHRYRELAKSPNSIVWSNPIELSGLDQPINHWGRVDKISAKDSLK